jgi:hypothetical protein
VVVLKFDSKGGKCNSNKKIIIDEENLRVVAQTICKELTKNCFVTKVLQKTWCNISGLLQLPQQNKSQH